MATGFLPAFEDAKVNTRDNMTLSVCGNNNGLNYVKSLKYNHG